MYCEYLEFDNWTQVQQSLIDYYNKVKPLDIYYPLSLEEVCQGVPEVVDHLKTAGIEPLQLIFLQFPGPTNLTSTDPGDSRTVYTHIDRKDEGEFAEDSRASYDYTPKYVLNIPLINCEKSVTFFYELIDKNRPELIWGGWGKKAYDQGMLMISHDNLIKVDQITVDKPAILRIDVPHGVHNPTENIRVVASIRIREDSPALKKLVGLL